MAILGLNSAAQIEITGTARRKAYTLLFLAMLLVAIPLMLTGQRVTNQIITELNSQRAAEEWAQGSDYRVRQVRAVRDSVYIAAIGHGEPPPFADLVTAVETAVGRPLNINLELLPSQIMTNRDP